MVVWQQLLHVRTFPLCECYLDAKVRPRVWLRPVTSDVLSSFPWVLSSVHFVLVSVTMFPVVIISHLSAVYNILWWLHFTLIKTYLYSSKLTCNFQFPMISLVAYCYQIRITLKCKPLPGIGVLLWHSQWSIYSLSNFLSIKITWRYMSKGNKIGLFSIIFSPRNEKRTT